MMGPVEYQGDDNCTKDCWVHAATGVLVGQLHISLGTNLGIDLDENEIWANVQAPTCEVG
jgi:hypothetical protein